MLVRGIELDMLEPTVAKKLLKVFEIAVPSEESTPLIDISVIDEWVELRLAASLRSCQVFRGFFAESVKLCS
jgi:hypothetical protein